ncbi:DUF6928 family protein [Corynebacterium frankenforstense]
MTMFGVTPGDPGDGYAEAGGDRYADFFDQKPISAAVTLWFVADGEPGHVARVLAPEPKADRGFGRKYLAQLRPSWPVISIGRFPLHRSAPAGRGEFYIAAFPGVTVVQTLLDGVQEISAVDPELRASRPARDVFAFARNTDADFGGFAHWRDGEIVRAFSALREGVIEDIGLPEPFEGPFWAGEHGEQLGGIALPFDPVELADAAESAWLGVDFGPGGPDVNVAAFAVDGRKEPRVDEESAPRRRTHGELAHEAATALNLGPEVSYDDYEDHSEVPSQGEEFARLAEAAAAAGRRVGRSIRRTARSWGSRINEAIRHSDRG